MGRPQPQQVISSGAKNNNSLVQHRESIDREARFSLYDFPSDSEGEDRPSSSASSPSKNLSQGKKNSPKPGFKKQQFSPAKPKIFPATKPALKKQPLPEGREQQQQQQLQHQEAEKHEHQQLEKQFEKQPQKEQQIT